MTPAGRLDNRYLVNFVEHKSNYCRVFLAKTEDVAAQNVKHFLFFEKRFVCCVHALRTDGGGEHKTLDLFKETGVARQTREARNQASSGKAERMHRTVLNVAPMHDLCMWPPLYFWGDAAQYAAYVLNRSPTKANSKRASPLEALTDHAPDLRKIVAFRSVCTAFRDPRNNSLQLPAQLGHIVGMSNETKGYRLFLRKDRVVVTQRVKNIETLTDELNAQLQRSFGVQGLGAPDQSVQSRRSSRMTAC